MQSEQWPKNFDELDKHLHEESRYHPWIYERPLAEGKLKITFDYDDDFSHAKNMEHGGFTPVKVSVKFVTGYGAGFTIDFTTYEREAILSKIEEIIGIVNEEGGEIMALEKKSREDTRNKGKNQ